MLEIILVKKEKGRLYKSENIVKALLGLELAHGEKGEPFIRSDEKTFISISDTKTCWACCISDNPVGIDIEESSRAVKPSVVKALHKEEQEYLAVLSEGGSEWREEFFSIWTRKEAFSKLCGKGLAMGFSKFSVLSGLVDGVPTASFEKNGLVFGIAGDTEAAVTIKHYDAPMEQSALDYAAGLLDARAYSSGELLKKLTARGYAKEEAETALEKLSDYGYVNDEAYAMESARRSAEKGKGSALIASELKAKGIDKDLAKEAAQEYKDGEYERALEQGRKILEKSGFFRNAVGAGDDTGAADAMIGSDYAFGCSCDSFEDPEESCGPSDFEKKKERYAQIKKLSAKVSRKLESLGYGASVIYSVLEDLGLYR